MLSNNYEKLEQYLRKDYSDKDPSHDFLHVLRVVGNCKNLAADQDVNLEILLSAALLHDIINVPKNSTDRKRASEMASVKAKKILEQLNYTSKDINKITKIIIEHSFSLGLLPSSKESALL